MSRMQRAALALFSLAVALSLAAYAQKPAAPGDEEAAVRAADEQWSQVAGAKDLEKTVGFYADDGILQPPGSPALAGKDAIRTFWVAAFQDPAYELSWKTVDAGVARSGDLAYTRGSYDFTYTAGGKVVREHGKDLVVWKRQADGSWKVVVDMFSADGPVTPIQP
jgi:uncharacterized protein (TIGR02246 family)